MIKYLCCQKFKIRNNLIREAFSEFLGTFTLMIFGIGSNAIFVLDRNLSSPAVVYIGWGFAVASGVYVAGGASAANLILGPAAKVSTTSIVLGGHINPAVTLSFAVGKLLPWKKVPVYMLAQYLGAFCACPVMYLVYRDAMNHFDGGVRSTQGENATAGIFATYPLPQVSVMGGFIDQTVAVAMLIILVHAIIDEKNMKPLKGLLPLAIGFMIVMFSSAFAMNCACPLNPARDLSPRIFTAIAGWGVEPFSFRNYTWFWVPVVAPHVGAVIGVLLYVGLIRYHWTFMPGSIEIEMDSTTPLEKQENTKLEILEQQ